MKVATINPTTDQLNGEKLLWPYPQKGVIVVLLLLDCVTILQNLHVLQTTEP